MQDVRTFAYSLSQADDGWRWRVVDEDGVTVAEGAHGAQADAQAAVRSTLRAIGQDLGAEAA